LTRQGIPGRHAQAWRDLYRGAGLMCVRNWETEVDGVATFLHVLEPSALSAGGVSRARRLPRG
jgi:hypothetical protein